MLVTPLGNLIIEKNGQEIDYRIIPQSLTVIEQSNYYVDARYLILVDTATIKSGDVIKCFIDSENVKTSINGGEYLVLLDFYKDNLLLSLGGYEILYHDYPDKMYAFDFSYMNNGLEAKFIDTQNVDEFRLAISWMDLTGGRDENATWYGSDPLMCDE